MENHPFNYMVMELMIYQFNVSSDEKSLTFKLPLLRCRSFNINFTRSNITANTLSISASLSINVINRPTVSNGTLNIEIYYIDYPISSSSSAPSITVENSSSTQCLIPDTDKLYAPPKVENRTFFEGMFNITFDGNNFGNSILFKW
ncbi:hypothetical protein ACTFIZ_008752 [Dictyostelium cf. discoideum]